MDNRGTIKEIKKIFPDYFERFDLPDGAKEESIKVYRGRQIPDMVWYKEHEREQRKELHTLTGGSIKMLHHTRSLK